jgi:C-terminal binding protein
MRNQYKVVITDFLVDPSTEREILQDLAEVEALNVEFEEQLVGRVETADAIMMYHCMSLSRKTIERLEQCKLIVRCGVGFDNVDWQFAASLGIPVANVPDYGTEEVADSAIGLTLALTRGFHLLNSQLRHTPEPWSYKIAAPVRRLRGAVFGVVGLGRIGTACAQRAKALGMDVVFYDPYKPDGYDKALQIRRVDSLEELLTSAYVVSLHCPLTPETRCLIGAPQIKMMQAGGYLINTARGGVVHTDAIPDAIASGRLAGAAIDVLEMEPPRADDPLLVAWRNPAHPAHHRLILNPHSAFYCEEGLLEMRVKGADACRRALLGLRLHNVVNGIAHPVSTVAH